MKKVIVEKPFGNFAVRATAQIPDELVDSLLALGALYVFERTPASRAEADVFAPMLGWEKGKKGGWIRPKTFTRADVKFDAALATKVAQAFKGDAKVPDTEDEVITFDNVVVEEHVIGEKAVPRKQAMALLAKATPAMLVALGVKDDMSYEDKVETAHKFLRSLRS